MNFMMDLAVMFGDLMNTFLMITTIMNMNSVDLALDLVMVEPMAVLILVMVEVMAVTILVTVEAMTATILVMEIMIAITLVMVETMVTFLVEKKRESEHTMTLACSRKR